jgi:hypothetical protein
MIKQKNTKAVELEMKNKMNVLRAAVIAGSVLAAGSVMAAGYDGELGDASTPSQGSVELTATIPAIVRVSITGDTELDFTVGDLSEDVTVSTTFCIESTESGGTANLTVLGSTNATQVPSGTAASGGSYKLYGSSTNDITYTVAYNGTTIEDSDVSTVTTSQLTDTRCTATSDSLVYTIASSDLQNAVADDYKGYSYLVVTPTP